MDDNMCFQQGPLIADIAVHVFSFLSLTDRQNVAKVCRYWRSTVYQPRLWKEVTVVLPLNSSDTLIRSLNTRKITRYTCLRSTEEDFSCLLTNITNLTHLNIKGCPQLSAECLKRTLKSLTNLEHLSFSRCRQLTNNLLSYYALVGSFDKLKSLALEDCINVTHVGFKALIKQLKYLETLHLTWCERLTDGCLKTLSDSCPKLSCLKLASCDWVTFSGIQYITQKLKHIKTLDLNNSHKIDDDCIRHVAEQLDLQTLDITGIPSLTRETIAFSARKLNGLKRLSFGGGEFYFVSECEQLEEMFDEISKLTQLEYFTFDVFDEKYDKDIELCIISLLKKLPNLKLLDLGSIKSIGKETGNTIADCMPELTSLTLSSHMISDNSISTFSTRLKKLKTLDLRSCSVSDHGIKAIATGLHDLESLTLSSHPKLTDVGVKDIARNLKSLTSLDLMSCGKLTDDAVEVIAKEMSQLVSLNLSYCHRISDKGAVIIGKLLKQLQHLILDSTNILDVGFVVICEQIKSLRTLGVGNCPLTNKGLTDGAMFLKNLEELDIGSVNITDEGIHEAVKYLGGLTEITLTLCQSVTVVGLEYILTGLPNLTHLGIEQCALITESSVRHLRNNRSATISVFDHE
ncbi:F-box/LRR-repeat protein 14-like [Actinia tenebrosa]|uniref:F-box/LRR-repeat protein 14-like n=1 Tax=Actinia tenebrosa TaxID=6105 RepID=A0A6P8IA75_ACTTE|nr:F-box/LRR-repeat protein 14-like [Actinia tenebrosa]